MDGDLSGSDKGMRLVLEIGRALRNHVIDTKVRNSEQESRCHRAVRKYLQSRIYELLSCGLGVGSEITWSI